MALCDPMQYFLTSTGRAGCYVRKDKFDQRLASARSFAPRTIADPVRVLDVSGVDDHAEQQTRGVDRDVPLPAPDLLGRVVAARPPFSVVLTLWVSTIAAVGLGSRPPCSRSISTRWWRIASQTPALAKSRM